MYRAQRVDKKNEIIFLVIMFTPRVIVFKMSKLDHYLYFKSASKGSYLNFSENAMNYRIPSYHFMSPLENRGF